MDTQLDVIITSFASSILSREGVYYSGSALNVLIYSSISYTRAWFYLSEELF